LSGLKIFFFVLQNLSLYFSFRQGIEKNMKNIISDLEMAMGGRAWAVVLQRTPQPACTRFASDL
jgi:hypothetical protein